MSRGYGRPPCRGDLAFHLAWLTIHSFLTAWTSLHARSSTTNPCRSVHINPSFRSRQIEFLEVRLSEVMAYADIPPSMRPALSEFDPVSMIIGKEGSGILKGGGGGLFGGASGIKAAQVEAVKRSILKSLGMLREIRQSLGESNELCSHGRHRARVDGLMCSFLACGFGTDMFLPWPLFPSVFPLTADKRNVSDAEYQRSVDAVMSQLTDAERATDGILKEAAAAASKPTPSSGDSVRAAAPVASQQHLADVPGDAGFLADEVADQLRERLKELARQLADLQVREAFSMAHGFRSRP